MSIKLLPEERIIIALDYADPKEAIAFMDQLGENKSKSATLTVKVGLELMQSMSPKDLAKEARKRGLNIFLDTKFHDITNTVAAAIRSLTESGASFVNLHASNGLTTMREANKVKGGAKLITVGVLTNLSDQESCEIYGSLVRERQLKFMLEAKEAGLDGFVCAGPDLDFLNTPEFTNMIKIVPGIRPLWASQNDQKRSMTPSEALRAGADYLVIGRPITNPPKEIGTPIQAFERIIAEISK